jgi:hydrogenase/urease accessory protein HupE
MPVALATRCPDWLVAALVAAVGLAQGLERGFTLRLQAQTALCQVEIERNTQQAAAADRVR